MDSLQDSPVKSTVSFKYTDGQLAYQVIEVALK